MHPIKLPYWLPFVILGREDEDPYERDDKGEVLQEDDEDVLKDGWEFNDAGDPVKVNKADPDDKGGDNEDDDLTKKVDALEKALRDERKLRRKAERDAKRSSRQKSTDDSKKEDEEVQKQLEAATEKTKKLAKGLLKKEVDDAILNEARRLGFIDPSDALLDDIRREVDADQDEDDPTDIEVDLDSVKDAVSDLAKRKKHLISEGGPRERSGGKFRKGSGKEEKGDDAVFQERYPSLR